MFLWITPVQKLLVCFPLMEGNDIYLQLALKYNFVYGLMLTFVPSLTYQVSELYSLAEDTEHNEICYRLY